MDATTTKAWLFWPRSLKASRLKDDAGQNLSLVGWSARGGPGELVIVIAGASVDHHIGNVKGAASTPREDHPRIIGRLHGAKGKARLAEGASCELPWVDAFFEASAEEQVWLTGRSRRVQLPDVSLHTGCAQNTRTTIILYDAPNPSILQFLSTEALQMPSAASLAFAERSSSRSSSRGTQGERSDERTALQHKLEELTLLDPRRHFEVAGGYGHLAGPGSGLRKAVKLMNASRLAMRKPTQSSNGSARHATEPAEELLARLLSAALAVPLSAARLLRAALSFQIKLPRGPLALKDVSAFANQLDLRLGQAVHWPSRGRRLRRMRRQERRPISEISTAYIGLWNGVWLVANDLIFGQAGAALLAQHHEALAAFLEGLARRWLVQGVAELLVWLASWPFGLKLNTELSSFFGDMFQGLTDVWAATVLRALTANLPLVLLGISVTGRLLGLTALLALASDVLNLATLHLLLFHLFSRSILNFFTHVLGHLFRLFRGKRRNPLRGGRIDAAAYDVDQLLLGTILFTLLAFLLPTVLAYHLAFGLARLGVVTTTVLLDTALALLNHLPLFALMLRIKDPRRLPQGVELRTVDGDGLELRSVPLTIPHLFAGYMAHLAGLRSLPRLCLALLTGGRLEPPRR